MPLAMRVPVLGMDDLGAPSPPRDEMAALLPPGMMTGVSFILYDGFHLDYDREFAFSLYDDYEEWKWTVDLD